MDIIEAIESRTSIRSYNGEPLTTEQLESINAAIACSACPIPGEWSADLQRFDIKGPLSPGTYGVIKGTGDFLLIGFNDREYRNAVAAGFAAEQVVLACTQMGLGTCWIGGTFKNSDFEAVTHFPEGMKLQAIIPVGNPAEKTRFIERVTRFTMGSKNRKPMGKLFFVSDWWQPANDSNMFYESLMMMRLAPSSTNSQPWRAIIKGDSVHFYCKDANMMHMIDMGIGLCHFDMAERYREHTGTWRTDAATAPAPAPGITYVASYTRD